MHHTCAYGASLSTTAETDIAALADQIIPITNGHFLPQRNLDLLYIGAAGPDISRARISTPTLQVVTTPFVRDVSVAATFGDPQIFTDYSPNPLMLVGLEEVTFYATNAAAAANRVVGVLGLQYQYQPTPAGRIYTLRGTATATLTANAWTALGTITWQNTLPTGTYAVVGAAALSAGGQAFRLIMDGQFYRPGGLAATTVGTRTDRLFRMGGLGVWGTFHNYAMPLVEMLSSSADTSETVFLDLVKIS